MVSEVRTSPWDHEVTSSEVAILINKFVEEENKEDFEIILELNAREREPDDSNICNEVKISLDYWRKHLSAHNQIYE